MRVEELKYGDKVLYTDPDTGIERRAVVCGHDWCTPGRIEIHVESLGCDEEVDIENLRLA